MLGRGAKMPTLTVTDDEGMAHTTGELAGRSLVLWFYPKDDTPG